MPGVFRYSQKDLIKECKTLFKLGIRAIALFPCTPSELKDEHGSEATNPSNLLNQTVSAIKKAIPELLIMTDVALDPYTSHGHDGILDKKGCVDNDATLEVLTRMSVLQAKAGADFIAPSDMMDGRVRAIRQSLDSEGFPQTGILAYSSKFASAYYGPFRDAVGSNKKHYLDKRTYQLNPANAREALFESLLDVDEGADILMVKPAGAYLDIIQKLRENTLLPIAAYQVSGEYAQIKAAAEKGWLDGDKVRDESLLAIKRAGADMILTYFAKEFASKK